MKLVKSLGADKVIDYTREDFTESGEKYDVIFNSVGKISASRCRRLLKKNGVYLSENTSVKIKTGDLIFLRDLIESGDLKPVVDKTYLMKQIVEAHRYVDTGRKKGNVIINVVKE